MSRNFNDHGICAVDEFMNNNSHLPPAYIRELQDEHNVNLHSDGTGDEYLDADEDDNDTLAIVDEDEFIERFTESGAAQKHWEVIGYNL